LNNFPKHYRQPETSFAFSYSKFFSSCAFQVCSEEWKTR
jgi:hypothetical protein